MRSKLRLDLSALEVESFAATAVPSDRGTVRGAQNTVDETLCVATCDPSYCVQASCDWSYCNNMSCYVGCGTGGGGGETGGAETCHICTNPE